MLSRGSLCLLCVLCRCAPRAHFCYRSTSQRPRSGSWEPLEGLRARQGTVVAWNVSCLHLRPPCMCLLWTHPPCIRLPLGAPPSSGLPACSHLGSLAIVSQADGELRWVSSPFEKYIRYLSIHFVKKQASQAPGSGGGAGRERGPGTWCRGSRHTSSSLSASVEEAPGAFADPTSSDSSPRSKGPISICGGH